MLVADDDLIINDLVARMLRALGFVAVPVCDGAAAVTAVAPYGAALAYALLDVQMPVMNGLDAAELIQQRMPTEAGDTAVLAQIAQRIERAYYGGQSCAAIAAPADQPVSTVMADLRQAVAALQACLSSEGKSARY